MKQIKAFIHHVRSAIVVEALRDAGYKNLTLLDVKGTLKSLNESEQSYSTDAGVVISEVRISLVCEDSQVDDVTGIIRTAGRIGPDISGWVYVSHIEQALPIGGPNN
ncbi:nitrogen regulatory protein P-II 1 [Zhongshania antarctica]|uniref:Nitrogen regulatory protein P-II 1 n=1 Tax=Zhongshania antarctica TaxID=641702 RepID=A0A840R8B6_9GAMM|nr:P-II family nitrogen regulator [Zhongshania antarctica]MBB5188844.1 nitrogen regulatory protein P-II 1 [Zhongshania antarctica]